MISPTDTWLSLETQEEKLGVLHELELVPPTQNYVREFYYSGGCVEQTAVCSVAGFKEPHTLIIQVNDNLHCIHADCLGDMQQGHYRLPEEYVVVDIDTTGESLKKDQITSFFGAKYRNRKLVDDRMISISDPEAAQLTFGDFGITLQEALCEIKKYIGNLPIVVLNKKESRIDFLKAAFVSNDIEFNNFLIEVDKVARKVNENLLSYDLFSLVNQFSTPTQDIHDPAGKANALSELLSIFGDELDRGKKEVT